MSLLLALASAFAAAPPVGTIRLAPGEMRVVSLPRANAEIRHDCPTRTAAISRTVDGASLQIEGKAVGSCALTIDGTTTPVQIHETRDADAATCSTVRERLHGSGLITDCRPGVVSIHGMAPDAGWDRVVERLTTSLPGVYAELSDRPKEEVEYTVSFLELRRSAGHDIGINTPAAVAALVGEGLSRLDGQQAASVGMFGPLADQISLEEVISRFEVLEVRTRRTVVDEPSKIFDGGEVYVKVASAQATSLERVDYGFSCEATAHPTALGYQMSLDVSVKETAPAASGEALRLVSRGTQGSFNIEEGQTIVIATGNSNRSWHNQHGIPWIQRVPVLGQLFGQDERSSSPTISAVLVTVAEPGHHPEWIERLAELKDRLGATWN